MSQTLKVTPIISVCPLASFKLLSEMIKESLDKSQTSDLEIDLEKCLQQSLSVI